MTMLGKRSFLLVAMIALVFVFGCTGAWQHGDSIPAGAAAKISPQLVAVAQQLEAGVDPARFARGPVRADAKGRIQVYVHVTQVTGDEVQRLTASGLEGVLPCPAMGIVQGWVRPQNLDTLAGLPFVTAITPPAYGYPQKPDPKR